jgi:hypothetical protein
LSNGKLAERIFMRYFGDVNRTLPRLTVIFAVLAALFFASNHCSFAALAAADEHACCHRTDEVPAQQSMTECCQGLNAPLPAVAEVPSVQLHVVLPAWDIVEPLLPSARDVAGLSEHAGYGPPGVLAFAELVLQQSLFSHAPPFVVA